MWGERTYAWQQPFLDVMAKSYGTGIYLEDFITQWDPARLAINAWVSTATDDKINDLLPSGSLDAATRMVLVDAIHLKLPWEIAFSATAHRAGHLHAGRRVDRLGELHERDPDAALYGRRAGSGRRVAPVGSSTRRLDRSTPRGPRRVRSGAGRRLGRAERCLRKRRGSRCRSPRPPSRRPRPRSAARSR